MGQRTNILLQIEARNGSHLNQVYHLQWGCRKYMPMAFLHILSSRYFKPLTTDIFEHFAKAIHLDGIEVVDKDWWRIAQRFLIIAITITVLWS